MKKLTLFLSLAAAFCCALTLKAQPAGEAFGVYKADVDELALVSGFNSRQSYYNARKRL